MREFLITYEPALGFVAMLEDDEVEDFDPVEYFLDCVHQWVMDTHRDDIDQNVKMEEIE